MTFLGGINESEIESGYFGEEPASVNPLVALGVIDKPTVEVTGISKVLARQEEESKDTGIGTKIAESFTGGLGRIKEAGEGLANDKFTLPEAFVRGGAGALQSFFSPVAGLIGEGVEEGIQALSDDFKANVSESVSPTINSVVGWYQKQSPEQKRNLENIGVGLEVLLEFVGGSAVKKPLQEIAGSAVTGAKKAAADGIQEVVGLGDKIKEGAGSVIDKAKSGGDVLKKLDLETGKGMIDGVEVDIPTSDKSVVEKISTPFRESDTKVLAGRALSPRTVGKSAKQKLESIQNVEKNANDFYKNVRTGVLQGDISTIENASQTVIDNIDTLGSRIGEAVKQVEGNINVDNSITDSISSALDAKGASVSPATPILTKFFVDLGDGNINISDAFELKKAYGNEVSKLYKAGDSGTKQYKALSDGVKFLNKKIDEIIDNKLGEQFAVDKKNFRNLKLIVDDIVSSTLVEGRRSPNTFAEQIGMIEGLLSPVNATKQLFIKEIGELNTRGGAWKELIKIYDQKALNDFSK